MTSPGQNPFRSEPVEPPVVDPVTEGNFSEDQSPSLLEGRGLAEPYWGDPLPSLSSDHYESAGRYYAGSDLWRLAKRILLRAWQSLAVDPARPLSWWTRAIFFLVGAVLPPICFLLAAGGLENPSWQTGNIGDVVGYMLSGVAAPPFYPLLAYPIVCLSIVLIRETAIRWFAVRLGIYTGVLIGTHFSVVFGISLADVETLPDWRLARLLFLAVFAYGATAVGWVVFRIVLPPIVRWISRSRFQVVRRYPILFILIAAYLIGFATLASIHEGTFEVLAETGGGLVFLGIVTPLLSAPFWFLGVYVAMSARVYLLAGGRFRFGLVQLLAGLTWLAGYFAAFRWSARLAMEKYLTLPIEDPGGCYVCTAAARGHRWFVQRESHPTSDGRVALVNDQMRVLKCFEIMLRVLAPRAHRLLRKLYDWLGPRCARWVRHPLAADAAYLALKPAEWLARLALAVCVARWRDFPREIYPALRSLTALKK